MRIFYKIKIILKFLGWNIDQTRYFFQGIPSYVRDYLAFKKQKGSNTDFCFANPIPMLLDKHSEAGVMSGQYFQQDLFVAQKIFKNNPERHVDIGSRIDGFVAHVASFREIEIFDIRQQKNKSNNILFKQLDLMQPAPSYKDYCDSISSLHAIEHFGLGRYGDPIDYSGHIKALENIHSILKPGGIFYFSTPIGEKQSIQFNAHRIFHVSYLLDLLKNKYQIQSLSYIDDNDNLITNADHTNQSLVEKNFGCRHGCVIFELIKI